MAAIDVTGGPSTDQKPAAQSSDTPELDLEVTKDTVTRGDKTSGLGRVLVQVDSIALADDIAKIALDALKARQVAGTWRIRVVDDPAALRGADTLALLDHRAEALEDALDAAVPKPIDAEALKRAMFAFAPIAVADLVLQGAGILGKLLAHDYQLSGREIPTDGLGFDLLVAHWLQVKHPGGVALSVDRVQPSDIAKTAIFRRLAALDEAARLRLAPHVTAAATELGEAKAEVTALTAMRDALHAQLVELMKVIDDKNAIVAEIARTRDEVKSVATSLASEATRAADAQAAYDTLTTLATEITTFLTEAAAPPADGSPPPIVSAARAEAMADGTYVLYVRLVASGMDEILDARVMRADTWTGLAGASAEFALLDGAAVLATGVRSTLQSTSVDLGHADRDMKQTRLNYLPVPEFKP